MIGLGWNKNVVGVKGMCGIFVLILWLFDNFL